MPSLPTAWPVRAETKRTLLSVRVVGLATGCQVWPASVERTMTPPSPTATAVPASAKATLKSWPKAPVERGAHVVPPSAGDHRHAARADGDAVRRVGEADRVEALRVFASMRRPAS